MTRKYSIGYRHVENYGRYQIWRSPRGRYSIITPDGRTIKSNLGSIDKAIQYLRSGKI